MEFKTQTLLLMKARDTALAMQLSAFGDISSLNQTRQPCHQSHCLIPVTPIARPLTTGKQRDQNACILWEGWFPKREEIEREREKGSVPFLSFTFHLLDKMFLLLEGVGTQGKEEPGVLLLGNPSTERLGNKRSPSLGDIHLPRKE